MMPALKLVSRRFIFLIPLICGAACAHLESGEATTQAPTFQERSSFVLNADEQKVYLARLESLKGGGGYLKFYRERELAAMANPKFKAVTDFSSLTAQASDELRLKIRQASFGSNIAVMKNDVELRQAIRAYALQWAKTYRPKGDAASEVSFRAFIVAYKYLAPDWTDAERSLLESWFRSVVASEVPNSLTRVEICRVELLSDLSAALNDESLKKEARAAFFAILKNQVDAQGIFTSARESKSQPEQVELIHRMLSAAITLHRAGALNRDEILLHDHPLQRALDGLKLAPEPSWQKVSEVRLGYAYEAAQYFVPGYEAEVRKAGLTDEAGPRGLSIAFYAAITPSDIVGYERRK